MELFKLFIFLLAVLRGSTSCELSHAKISIECLTSTTMQKIQKFEVDLNTSRVLQRDDRKQMASWSDEYQLKRLDVTIMYRMQMLKHQEHSLKSDDNTKWVECLYVHRQYIRRSIKTYLDNEHECLKAATAGDADKKDDVNQIEKQIVKWRKSYRYLVNLCKEENPSDRDGAHQCLIEYMQNDKYDEVIQRLLQLKKDAMEDLQSYFNSSLSDLEECLKTQLSSYLERIRAIMEVLRKCYSMNT